MNKWLLIILCVFIAACTQGQVVVTAHNNASVDSIIQNFFVGGGVNVSNVKFNDNLNLGVTNQFGTFTNQDTTGNNVKLKNGIVIVTGKIQDASSGNAGVHSSGSYPVSNNSSLVAPLRTLLNNRGATEDMYDIGVLSFDFVPQDTSVSFSYVFASDEYPEYVCSQYNDAFGFFVSGPYLDNGNEGNFSDVEQLHNKNIAIVPGTTSTPIAINTVNNGQEGGNASYGTTCILNNSAYFIQLPNNSPINKMQGYTKALQTQHLKVKPCYKYHLMIAICDVGDTNYNSCVFLGGKSFKTDNVSFNFQTAVESTISSNDTIYKTPCDSLTLTLTLNRLAQANETYTLNYSTDLVAGVDYQPFDSVITFPNNDSVARVVIHFLSNSNDVAGQSHYIRIIEQQRSSCITPDTINIRVINPSPISLDSITPSKDFCNNVIPIEQRLFAKTSYNLGRTSYSWKNLQGEDIGNTPDSTINSINITKDTTLVFHCVDYCNRQRYDTIRFSIYPIADTTIFDTICKGTSYTNYGFNEINSGSYTHHLTSTHGCDSTLTLNLTVREIVVDLYDNICQGLDYDKYGFVINNARVSQIYTKNSQTIEGCDSVTNLHLNVFQVNNVVINDFIYEDDMHYNGYGFDVDSAGTFIRNDIDSNGCTYSLTLNLTKKESLHIYLPSAFTPLGNNNHEFCIYSDQESLRVKDFNIFNRWGEKVYESNDISKCWDGKYKGSLCKEGTYVYRLLYYDKENPEKMFEKTGVISLVH
jgi:gliding motility-associated-like protein